MATSLAAQLAQIAAKSKTSLDVKAQKAAHSKSLLFEPRIAAGQSFQSIYSLCRDGFDELCQLDEQFTQFSSTLFSEQSQDEDRNQMSSAENAELDKKIESFLRLCGSRLRIMPAMKALEWLIRRFRIHEFNTAALIATFLPYHTIPAFLTVMSILPANLPHEYRFLDPYIRSLTAPPRASIVREATHHFELLSAISSNTLESCRAQQQYPALISFWGGIMTEAVNGMLDNLRSGRKSVQADNDQALLQQIGPIVAEALVMKKVPGIQIAAYMVVSVFVAKTNLSDLALSAFMEQIVHGWTSDTVRPGLVCLSILAQYRSGKQLSSKVTKAMLKVPDLPQLLLDIGKDRRVDKLASSLVLALVDRLARKGAVRGLPLIKSIILGGLLEEKQLVVAFKGLLLAAHSITDELDTDGTVRRELGSSLVILCQTPGDTGDSIRKVIEDVSFDIEELELKLDASIRPRNLIDAPKEDAAMTDGVEEPVPFREDLASAMERLSRLRQPASSCLSRGSDSLFEELCHLFLASASDREELLKFDEVPLLSRANALSDCFYFSFYMRVWSGPYPTLARVAALEMAKNRLKQDDCLGIDFQAILPYCIAAMNDPVKKIRRSAADLLVVLGDLAAQQQGVQSAKETRWGSEKLYEESDDLAWLTPDARQRLLEAIIIPSLEESVLHQDYLSELLRNVLDSSSRSAVQSEKGDKPAHLSHGARLSILSFLASHAVYTPLLTLKVRLLRALNQIRGVSGTSRTQLLLPLLRWWAGLTAEQAQYLVSLESLDESLVDASCVDIVVPNDKAGLECLFETIQGGIADSRPTFAHCIFSRIRKMWPVMKAEAQHFTAVFMLEKAQRPLSPSSVERDIVSEEAAELLRSVPLSTDILSYFLDSLVDAANLATEPPPAKRRRTSSSDHNRGHSGQPTSELKSLLNKVTFVLQLIEASKPAEHPELLQGLFLTLSHLQTLRSLVGSDLGYLQNLVLSCLLAMMPAYRNNKNLKIDASVGHGDILVTCVQKSSSPAVQNAALLLVANLAKTAPDVVLHSVMPIFTFMGSSVLRQGDDYSAHVVNQTIREVIPPLIETFRKGKRNVVASAAELLSSFVIAYEHIPSHRKHDLFIRLTENLGPEDFLFAIVAMFADKYGTADSIIAFLKELMGSFTVKVQLQALVKLVALVGDVFKPKPHLSVVLLSKKEDGEQDLQKSALKQLTLLPRLLANRRLKDEIGKLADRDDMEASEVQELYASLLEDILTLADTVKSKKPLHARCGEALANLLNLLSIGEFIKAVEKLLDRPSIGLRQKVLRALEVRVDDESTTDSKSRTALLAFLPQLTAVIRESDDIAYKHTAVLCVDKIAEKYGKKDIEAVAAAASTIAGEACLGQEDRRLRINALLCLASVVDVLQEGMVPILPIAIPKALAYLQGSLVAGADSDTQMHNAAYSFFTALAQHLPYMISGAYLDELLASSSISAEAGMDEESNTNRQQCLDFLATQVEAKTMLTALQRNWRHAVDAGYSAVTEFLQVLGKAIDKQTKTAVAKNVTTLAAIVQGALDLRREMHDRGLASGQGAVRLAEIEDSTNTVALKMIYRLNDAAFRPVFSQLMEWSEAKVPGEGDLGRTLRLQSVYRFLFALFDNLKSAVTNYSSYVADSAASILKRANPKNGEDRELWKRVLKTLSKCFEYDQEDFWQAPSHFGAIAPVLTEQFLHATTVDATEELIPAVVELAAKAESQDHRKELNGAILRHLRSEHAAVRLAAVKCQQALTDRPRLAEEWLAMLPELLPFISELQDDDDEVVERETQRWIVKIEGVLGESLDNMLQ